MKKILLLTFFACVSLACNDDEVYSQIPSAPVLIELRLDFDDNKLQGTLAYKEITQPRLAKERIGYGGILVINGFGQGTVNLYAYDLSCPVEVNKNIRIKPDDTGKATCPKCGAVFNIAFGNGTPESGTKHYLKSYPVYRVPGGGNTYQVTN